MSQTDAVQDGHVPHKARSRWQGREHCSRRGVEYVCRARAGRRNAGRAADDREHRHELACRRDDPDRARIAYSFDEVAARSARRLDHVGRWRRRGLRVGSVVRLAVGSASDTREFESASRAVLVLVRGCGRARSDARGARVIWAASATAEASGRVTCAQPNRSLRVVGIVSLERGRAVRPDRRGRVLKSV